MALLSKITGGLKDILNINAGDSVVGIDIGSAFIKVVQLKKDGETAVLETYGELALGPYAGLNVGSVTDLDATQLSQAVESLFQDANITTRVASLSIPLGSTLLSLVEMPDMENEKLQDAVPKEARKYIPVSMEDVSLDWWVIPPSDAPPSEENKDEKNLQNGRKPLEVLIVAIHNSVLEKYNNVISQAELKNSSLEIEVFSAVRATLNRDMSAFMIFDMGAETTKLSIVEQGIIKVSHIINQGSQNMTKTVSDVKNVTITRAEEMKRKTGLVGEGDEEDISRALDDVTSGLLSEANDVLLDYQTKHRRTVTKVVLIGGGVLLKGFGEKAQAQLATDVIYGEAFSKVENPIFLDPVLKEAGPEFAVALGLALRKLQDI